MTCKQSVTMEHGNRSQRDVQELWAPEWPWMPGVVQYGRGDGASTDKNLLVFPVSQNQCGSSMG